MAKSHVQRPAVQLRYGKAQLVIFPAGERPAQRLLRINPRSIASEYGMASRSIRAPQPLALRIWPRSEISPSERSIADVARVTQRTALQHARHRPQMTGQQVVGVRRFIHR